MGAFRLAFFFLSAGCGRFWFAIIWIESWWEDWSTEVVWAVFQGISRRGTHCHRTIGSWFKVLGRWLKCYHNNKYNVWLLQFRNQRGAAAFCQVDHPVWWIQADQAHSSPHCHKVGSSTSSAFHFCSHCSNFGEFEAGSEKKPFQGDLEITLTGTTEVKRWKQLFI